ncbi:ABC-2 family transporter protein [Caulifigura coniformis]|uniref:ABC-2 family transporter protein n=1 Tax=Caulifigura coniformis TaxID=2527983 RepID=A0A517SGX5_9PLAN|nr:ABC transporter permease [Caulifigura coniformis]QDT55376.1 ABC-2 family transporter protein [Caulifigura coniformis]
MLAGPLFRREVLINPRPLKHYLMRAGYVLALFVLMYTAGQATIGWQTLGDIGDAAKFGTFLFSLFAMVQLTIVIAASLLFGSSTVAQEKDKRTLVLLLMTDLSSVELVVGKLLSALLTVLTLIAVSLPVFALVHTLGGVSMTQVLWVEVICIAAALAAGAWGVLVAFWREKTFQTLAISVLGAVLFLGLLELGSVAAGAGSGISQGLAAFDPYRAVLGVLNPLAAQPGVRTPTVGALSSTVSLLGLAAVLTAYTVLRVRTWNPSQLAFEQAATAAAEAEKSPSTNRHIHRKVWDAPILWREIATRAYGRKMFVIKAGYFVFAALAVLFLYNSPANAGLVLGLISREGFAFMAVSILALVLTNAQAVTSITSERDGQTMELVMVTEVSSREFILGKLGGVFFNMKEVLAVPVAFVLAAVSRGTLGGENAVYVLVGLAALAIFAAMLGIHQGLTYEISRQAIAHSLGTIFFLFVGIFICMMLIVEARSSYSLQFLPFLGFILGGSMGLYASLSRKNQSPALMLSAGILPFATFYSITSYLLGNTLGVCVALAVAYGIPTVAMFVPAASGYDVALGRSSDKG